MGGYVDAFSSHALEARSELTVLSDVGEAHGATAYL